MSEEKHFTRNSLYCGNVNVAMSEKNEKKKNFVVVLFVTHDFGIIIYSN